MESNTKFGLALIVLLAGTLAFVVYKKMDRRRAEEAAAAQANPQPDGGAQPVPSSVFDRQPSRELEDAAAGDVVAGLPPQSEPPLDDEPESRSAAYRPAPEDIDISPSGDGPFGKSDHPLRRVDAMDAVAQAEPSPFPPAGGHSAAEHVESHPASSNPFADPADAAGLANAAESRPDPQTQELADSSDDAGRRFPGTTVSAGANGGEPAGSETIGRSPFDPGAIVAADNQPTHAGSDDGEAIEAPWSAVKQVQIEGATTASIESAPTTTTAVPVSHAAPWDEPASQAATHAVGAGVKSPPFSPAQVSYDSRPQSTAPPPAATAAEAAPWDPVGQSAASSATSGPFDTDVPQTSVERSRPDEQRQLENDLSTLGGAGQSFARSDDHPAIHTVRSGDTYWDISRKHFGTGRYYRALGLYNSHRIPDPRRMQKGMKVLVPEREILESRFASVLPKRSGTPAGTKLPSGLFHQDGQVLYRVGRGDTLGGIAERHLGRATRWREIVQLNAGRLSNPAVLKIGMELRLPADASRVRVVSEASERR